ncbi:MAG: hypothetical protein PWP57_1067 [Candidatus Atribacteria bacterium]|nr:hypothetical protein [Candidatus Atribacteria bacterium]
MKKKAAFITFLVFSLLFCRVTPLWAADDPFSLIERSSYSEEDKEYLRHQVDSLVKEAEEKDLPLSPIVSKLKEGLAKKVLPYELVKTLNTKKNSLEKAQEILQKNGVKEKDLIVDLALSLELSVPPQVIEEALSKALANDGKRVELVVDSLSALLEMGVDPEKAGKIVAEAANNNFSSKDMKKVAQLLERARRAGADSEQVAKVLADALEKYDNFNLVEMEVQKFIASSREKSTVRSGQGVIISSPGIASGGTPAQEGGTPLENTPSSGGKPPTQEGGTPLESSASSEANSSTGGAEEQSSSTGSSPIEEGGKPLE